MLCIPLYTSSKKKTYLKPDWTPKVKDLNDDIAKKDTGKRRPSSRVVSFTDYKRQIKNKLYAEHCLYVTDVIRDTDEASECDLRIFLKLI